MSDRPTFKVEFKRSKRTLEAPENANLLDLAFHNQINIPSLCRGGSCGTCRVKILRGTVEQDSQKLDSRARRQGYALACSSRVVMDIVVDA